MKKVFLLTLVLLSGLLAVFGCDVLADDQYYGYTDTTRYSTGYQKAYYVQPVDASSDSEMVFCLNEFASPPPSNIEGLSVRYTKIAIDADYFGKALQNPYYYSAAHLDWNRKYILNIIYNAYYNPQFDKKGLSEESIRKVVQMAIWYYTDSYGYKGDYPKLSDTEKVFYSDLVYAWDDNIDQKISLDMYVAQDSYHQHLIGTHVLNKKAVVNFQLQDADHSEKLLDGATFKVINGDGLNGHAESYTTSSDDTYIRLYPGIYRIIEKTQPADYLLGEENAQGKVIRVYEYGRVAYRDYENNVETWKYFPNNTIVFANKKAVSDLTLTNTVSGNAADKGKDFTFNITLKGSDNSPFSGQVTTTGNNRIGGSVTFTDGKATITLKDGETITFEGLATSSTYDVEEVDAADYLTSLSIDGGASQAAKDYTNTLEKDTSLAFTNTKDIVPPTGVAMMVAPYLLLGGLVVAVGGCLYIIKRKSR